MRTDDSQQFDDPVLKSAVKKAYAHENAPESLRRRIAELSASNPDAGPIRLPSSRRPWLGWLAAAIVLLGIGAAVSQYMGLFSSSNSSVASSLPQRIVDGMVATHDSCGKLPDHHLLTTVTSDDMVAIQKSLKDELQRPVLAAQLGGDWKFQGAGICKVANQFRAGHLLFTRGSQTVSLFSLGPVAYDIQGDGNYELMASGHPFAGFATREGLFCLVGYDPSGALTVDELAALRDKLRGQVVSAGPPAVRSCPSQLLTLR